MQILAQAPDEQPRVGSLQTLQDAVRRSRMQIQSTKARFKNMLREDWEKTHKNVNVVLSTKGNSE
jgi:chemotaxis protein histidine kinase CheA